MSDEHHVPAGLTPEKESSVLTLPPCSLDVVAKTAAISLPEDGNPVVQLVASYFTDSTDLRR
jgi:hypothetical protein